LRQVKKGFARLINDDYTWRNLFLPGVTLRSMKLLMLLCLLAAIDAARPQIGSGINGK